MSLLSINLVTGSLALPDAGFEQSMESENLTDRRYGKLSNETTLDGKLKTLNLLHAYSIQKLFIMKRLIFDLVIFSSIILNSPEVVVGQEGQVKQQGQERAERNSRFYILSNMDKALQFRRSRFDFEQSRGTFPGNGQQSNYLTIGNPGNSDTYSDLKFQPGGEATANRLELVRKIDPQLYKLNLKAFTPSPYTKKNDFKIAEQLLLILLQENQRKANQ